MLLPGGANLSRTATSEGQPQQCRSMQTRLGRSGGSWMRAPGLGLSSVLLAAQRAIVRVAALALALALLSLLSTASAVQVCARCASAFDLIGCPWQASAQVRVESTCILGARARVCLVLQRSGWLLQRAGDLVVRRGLQGQSCVLHERAQLLLWLQDPRLWRHSPQRCGSEASFTAGNWPDPDKGEPTCSIKVYDTKQNCGDGTYCCDKNEHGTVTFGHTKDGCIKYGFEPARFEVVCPKTPASSLVG